MELIYDHNLPEQFRASAMYTAADFDTRAAEFKQWCADNSVFYYCRPRESFFTSEGIELATAAGATKLLLEDLS